jgi:hypothetical protein
MEVAGHVLDVQVASPSTSALSSLKTAFIAAKPVQTSSLLVHFPPDREE